MSAFTDRIRTTLRTTRQGKRRITDAHIAQLTDVFSSAIADYKDRRAWNLRAKREPAHLFAEDMGRQVKKLIATIHRRKDALGTRDARRGTIALPMEPTAWFTAHAVTWLPMLRRWQAAADAEAAHLKAPPWRPRDDVRLMLECPIADALDRAGLPPTKAREGAFARVLREVIYPEVDLSDRDAESAVKVAIETLPEWRALPPWRRRLPRASKPAAKI